MYSQRPLWRHYYQNTDVIILVVDSNDRDRITESGEELKRLLAEEQLKDAALLVMANKQDLPNAMSVTEITEKLEIDKIKDRKICKCKSTTIHDSSTKFSVLFFCRCSRYLRRQW